MIRDSRSSASLPTAGLALAFVLLVVLANGYEFGTSDHAIHVPFAEIALDPEWYAGDLLTEALPHHLSIFSHVVGALGRVLPYPLVFGALHLFSLFALGVALIQLTRTLWESERAVPAVLLSAAVARVSLGGVETLDPRLLHRGFALPIELFSLYLVLAGRSVGGFLLAGLALSIHAPSAVPVLIGLAVAQATFARQEGWKGWLSPLAALPTAAPVLWPTLREGGAPLFARMDDAWWSIISVRLGHHVDPAQWPIGFFVLFGATVVVTVLALAAAPPQKPVRLGFFVFMGALLAWTAIAGLGAPRLGLALLHQFEPWETTRLLVLLGHAAAAAWIAELRPADSASAALRVAALAVLVLGQPVALLLPALLLDRAGGGGILALGTAGTRLAWSWLVAMVTATALSRADAGGVLDVLDGFALGRQGPVRPGWLLDVGPAAALVAVGAFVLRDTLLRGDFAPEDWPKRAAKPGFRLSVAAAFVLAGQAPADGHQSARLILTGPGGETGAAGRAARSLLPPGSVLAGPPSVMHELRPHLRQGVVVSWKDGGEALFDRDFAMRWRSRLSDACACDPLQPLPPEPREASLTQAEIRRRIDAGQFAMSAEVQRDVALRAGATHLLLATFDASSRIPGQEPIWRNAAYHLYAIAPR